MFMDNLPCPYHHMPDLLRFTILKNLYNVRDPTVTAEETPPSNLNGILPYFSCDKLFSDGCTAKCSRGQPYHQLSNLRNDKW